MSEFHYYVQFMVRDRERLKREGWDEAQIRARLHEARDELHARRPSRLRNLIGGLRGRSWRRSSAPCADAGAPC